MKIGGRRAVLGARERDTAHAEMDRVPCDNLQNALVLLRRGAQRAAADRHVVEEILDGNGRAVDAGARLWRGRRVARARTRRRHKHAVRVVRTECARSAATRPTS